ncbi:RluA family pseudouridine synthase [Sulfuritalea hydrogenivorans]|uniref:Pseudouridine synthase n=1 Tax=Sulfuritalea hydrogenivorans sk43H TaxID=1223802 RepID=W0SGL6_9PROT|nr:pseudouridine synthase [Sulfuritalea hydrogenivorans sk43H]
MVKTSHEHPVDYSRSPCPPRTVQVPADCAGWRLDATLATLFPEHSRSRLQGWLKAGLIRLDGGAAEGKRKVYGGERIDFDADIAVAPAPSAGDTVSGFAGHITLANAAEDIGLVVVFEDEHLIVIDKPAGLVVHPGNGNASGTMMNALLHHAPQLAGIPRAGIVHRLDKDTSGLLVVAKTLTAQTDLVRQMQARSVKRHYLALALGTVERDGTVDAPLGRHAVQRTKMAIVRAGGKEARTHYAVLERFAKATLLECRLETGRTHQIRVHLASIKHPLAGDATYGKTKSGDARLDAFPRQALHAWRLALVHPATGAEMAWESPLPADFSQLLDELRRG